MRFRQLEGERFGELWYMLVRDLVMEGMTVSPRGMPIHEITNMSLLLHDAHQNILVCAQRQPSYRFMVAEWLWIWFGRNDVASISQFNKNIAKFSDNGDIFAGAYGPPLAVQWSRTLELLHDDPDTRQAVIQIYQRQVHPTKDVPCTLALQFMIRNNQLDVTAYMRSSDAWLGLPYDAFNFSMLGNIMAGLLNMRLGSLTFHLGSSHLYDSNLEAALRVLDNGAQTVSSPRLLSVPPVWLNDLITDPGATRLLGSWTPYARVLKSKSNDEALEHLQSAYDTTV